MILLCENSGQIEGKEVKFRYELGWIEMKSQPEVTHKGGSAT